MTIAPIRHAVTVKAAPDKAFALFAGQMERWWPVGRTVGQKPHVAIIIEPRPEGRWFERDADGNETQWGKVLVWEPPTRLLLGWQLNSSWTYDPGLLTEVELTFVAEPGGGTKVSLEHRDLERFGVDAEKVAGLIGNGWPTLMGQFANWANADA
jgi:uncharacterized protein YndB with AHSA1/START domain